MREGLGRCLAAGQGQSITIAFFLSRDRRTEALDSKQ